MSNNGHNRFSSAQQVGLVALRTLIGWHFLYEGYYKLALPAWGRGSGPIAGWSSEGFFKTASGPLASLFQRMIDAGWLGWIDDTVKIGLILIGLSLMLGLFTRVGCWIAVGFLALVYLASVPFSGLPQPGGEGTDLIVNKTLIEAAAVLVLITFRTGEIAGLDLLFIRRKSGAPVTISAAAQAASAAASAKSRTALEGPAE